MTAAADFLKGRLGALAPRYGIVLGSGLGSLVNAVAEPLRIPYADIPGFPVSSVSGHAGEFVAGRIGDTPVAVLSGRAHYYERGDANAMRVPIETLKRIGVENLILTNSAGSLREDMPPGSVMRIADHIAFAGANPLIGVESDERFVGMTNAYDAALAIGMEEAAERLGIPSRAASICGSPGRASRRRPKSAWPASSVPMRSACPRCRRSFSPGSSGSRSPPPPSSPISPPA